MGPLCWVCVNRRKYKIWISKKKKKVFSLENLVNPPPIKSEVVIPFDFPPSIKDYSIRY